MLASFFYFLSLLTISTSKRFIWQPDDAMTKSINWVGGSPPCAGDRVVFDEDKIVVTLISDGLDAEEVMLPNDGVIFLASDTVIGEKGGWQCERRPDGPITATFDAINDLPNIFDWQNWEIEGEKPSNRSKLNCEQVPSQDDEAIFPITTASRTGIDAAMYVNKLNYSGEYKNDTNFILTLEGQMIVVLGPNLKTRFAIDNVDYQMPNTEVMHINKRASTSPISANALDPQLTEMCNYVKCRDTTEHCLLPVRPVGHCCEVCGAVLTFSHPPLDISLDELIDFDHYDVNPRLGVSMTPISGNSHLVMYQIAVISDDPAIFDEDEFFDTAVIAYGAVYQYIYIADVTDYEANTYDIHVSYQLGKWRWGVFFETLGLICVAVAVVGCYLWYLYRKSPRFRLWLANQRRYTQPIVVSYQNARNFAEDKIEIIRRKSDSARLPNPEAEFYHAEFSNPTFENPNFENVKIETVPKTTDTACSSGVKKEESIGVVEEDLLANPLAYNNVKAEKNIFDEIYGFN